MPRKKELFPLYIERSTEFSHTKILYYKLKGYVYTESYHIF